MDNRLTPELDGAPVVASTRAAIDVERAREQRNTPTIDALLPLYASSPGPSHDSIVIALRRRRNGLQPVNRLPVEVLSAIFRLYTFALHNDEERTVHNVSLVICAHWRAVALNDSLLWRRLAIPAGAVHLTDVILTRSKRNTLNLEITLSGCGVLTVCEAAGRAVADHLDHIQTLILVFGTHYGSTHAFLRQLSSTPALRLERLGLHYDDNSDTGHMDIPYALFGHCTPKLRALQLENVLPSGARHFLMSSPTSQLEEICASGSFVGKGLPSRGLCALFNCRTVTTLALRDLAIAEPDRDQEFQSSLKWQCDGLQSLTLESVESVCALHILGRVPLSSLRTVSVRVTCPDIRLHAICNAVMRSVKTPSYVSARGDRSDISIELADEGAGISRTVHARLSTPLHHLHGDISTTPHWSAFATVLRTVRTSVQRLWVSVDLWPGVVGCLSPAPHSTPPFSIPANSTVPALPITELTLELPDISNSTHHQQHFQAFEPALRKNAILRVPLLSVLRIVSSKRRSTIGGYLLNAFLEINLKVVRVPTLVLENVEVEPGPAFDAVQKMVDKIVFV